MYAVHQAIIPYVAHAIPYIRQRERDVRFVPKADILRCSKERRYSIASSAIESTPGGISMPSARAL